MSAAHTFGSVSLGEFADRLASADPVPGGGSASAIAGALAASLVVMVATLSQGRPRYAEHAALHDEAIASGAVLKTTLLRLAEEDSAAYAQFLAVSREANEASGDDGDGLGAARAAAAMACVSVPLRCVEACYEVVALAEALAGRSNRNASSDLNVAAFLGEAAARGAAANVQINLPLITDESWAGAQMLRAGELVDAVERLAATTHRVVGSGDAREPVEIRA